MSKVEIIKDSIFNSEEKYIVHQTNCITTKGAHLSKTMFDHYPYANVYQERSKDNHRDTPGTIIIRGNGDDERYVINLFGQYYPGNSKYDKDSYEKREQWFKEGLKEILAIDDLESVAFPYGIGCGAAGGKWENYLKMINKFADKTDAIVRIYKHD